MPRIDLDHNATTPLDPRARDAMVAALAVGGNPSSIHEAGRRARDVVEQARDEVARLTGGGGTIVFTSGGTEADALGVVGGARAARRAGRPARVVTTALEHPAVQAALEQLAGEGFEIVRVPVDGRGVLDGDRARAELARGAALSCFLRAHHELGNLYDPPAGQGAWSHCDAVQAAGKLPVDAAALGVDSLAISAHKFHGPKGVGALWVRRGAALEPLIGGHQERGLRGGTENVAGIVGMGVAARLAREEAPATWTHVQAWRDRLEAAALAIAGARRNGNPDARGVHTANLAFDGVPGDLLVAALDLEGVAASTGAACASGSVEPSPALLALGQPRARAAEAVRFSLGAGTTAGEIDRVAALLPGLVARIRLHATREHE